MSENYIVINGKKAELTPEQLKALGLEMEIKSPFEREYLYYFIDTQGNCVSDDDNKYPLDDGRYKVANYCTDREIMQQRALHETLNRLLWRYSMENKGNEIDWSIAKPKYRIIYDHDINKWNIDASSWVATFSTVYFATSEIAKDAIKEIVEPFMAKHPDFKL